MFFLHHNDGRHAKWLPANSEKNNIHVTVLADGVCGERLGSGRETRVGTPNREGEESHDQNAGIYFGRS